MKLKTIYICQDCRHESQKWIGKCPHCNAWNSFTEDVINIGKTSTSLTKTPRLLTESAPPKRLHEIKSSNSRIATGIKEFDNVIGGGLIPGSITLLSGEPGIGKSTLTLQLATEIARTHKVLLVSAEESVEQIAQRAKRLKLQEENLILVNEFSIEGIIAHARAEKAPCLIIDSIQVIASTELDNAAGSITQVRYATEQIMEFAKTTQTAVILIGHVTKDGTLAGPRVLEHLVDTVLSLEGDRYQQFRMLRAAKNRFGSCTEVGVFDMTENGLVEVKNPSEILLEGRKEDALGSCITVALEGTRPFLIEVQALVSTTPFGYPKRTANGFDINRLQILIAVLEKYGKCNLQNQDVFVNVVGGIRISEPAADLAVLSAVASSFFKKPLPRTTVVFGEVGLSGELRKVAQLEKRKKEAEKLGFTTLITPEHYKEINQVLQKISGSSDP